MLGKVGAKEIAILIVASVTAWVTANKVSDVYEKKRKAQLDREDELIFKKMKDSNK